MTTSIAKPVGRQREQFRGIVAYGMGPALGILSGPILAASLGPSGRGQLAAIMQPVTVAGAVAGLGIPSAVAYLVARNRDPRQTAQLGMLLLAAPAVAVYGCLVGYSHYVAAAQHISQSVLLIAWTGALMLATIEVRRGMLQGLAMWRWLDRERAANAASRFVAVVIVVLIGVKSVDWYAYASLLSIALAALVLLGPAYSRVEPLTYFGPGNIATSAHARLATSSREIATFALPAAIGTIATAANNRLDQVLFPVAGTNIELGYYSVAVTVAEVPLVFSVLTARNLLTAASRSVPPREMLRSVMPYFVTAIILSLCTALAAGFAVPLVFGANFAPAVSSVQILCLGTVFTCIAASMISIVCGWGRPGLASVVPATGLVSTTVGFVAQWGEVSSRYASIVASASQALSVSAGALIVYYLRAKRKVAR